MCFIDDEQIKESREGGFSAGGEEFLEESSHGFAFEEVDGGDQSGEV